MTKQMLGSILSELWEALQNLKDDKSEGADGKDAAPHIRQLVGLAKSCVPKDPYWVGEINQLSEKLNRPDDIDVTQIDECLDKILEHQLALGS